VDKWELAQTNHWINSDSSMNWIAITQVKHI